MSEPVPSASARANLPPDVDAVFRRALAKRPDDRYATGASFVAALRTALAAAPTESHAAAPTAATVALPRTVPRRSSSRKPLVAVLLGAALLALVLAGVLLARTSSLP